MRIANSKLMYNRGGYVSFSNSPTRFSIRIKHDTHHENLAHQFKLYEDEKSKIVSCRSSR